MKYKPYLRAFKNGFSAELAYPINFLFGRIRNIVVLILMYYVWQAVFLSTKSFFNVSLEWFLSYIFISHIVKSFVIGSQFREVAYEITSGTFSKFLIQPVHHGFFHFSQGLASRCINTVSAFIEVALFCVLFSFIPQVGSLSQIGYGIVFVVVATMLYFLLVYTVQLFAFWSREASGPLFFFEWFMEFMSGSMFPLFIAGQAFLGAILLFPFPYTVYIPSLVFLKNSTLNAESVIVCIHWCILLSIFSFFIYRKGLRQYSGEGI